MQICALSIFYTAVNVKHNVEKKYSHVFIQILFSSSSNLVFPSSRSSQHSWPALFD